jgi:hypothetical protein
MIVVIFINADIPIMGIVAVNTPTVAALEFDVQYVQLLVT